MKTCTKCGEEKPLAEFHYRKKAAGLRHAWCRLCMNRHSKMQYHANVGQRRTRSLAYSKSPEARLRKRAYLQTPRGRTCSLYMTTKSRAKKLNVAFDLDKYWIETRLIAGVCEVTGLEFDLTVGCGRGPFTPSIDRVEARAGYIKENCRVVCWSLNSAMGTWGLEPVLEIAATLLENENGR